MSFLRRRIVIETCATALLLFIIGTQLIEFNVGSVAVPTPELDDAVRRDQKLNSKTDESAKAAVTLVPRVKPATTTAAGQPDVTIMASAPSPRDALFKRTYGYNPPRCNVQPNRTDIDPYKGCPLPGLNNLLFTQINRWYCAVRDNAVLQLRDRTCNKGSEEPFRYSTILQVNYPALEATGGSLDAALCWSDISRQDKARHCEWADIPGFYGNEQWWTARKLIDFHSTYYDVAARFVETVFHSRPFLSVHLRRGDYWQHCVVIKRRGVPPWISFKNTKKLFDYERGCYPSLDLVEETLKMQAAAAGVKDVFIATNTPEEFEPLAEKWKSANQSLNLVLQVSKPFLQSIDDGSHSTPKSTMRKLDGLIIEMAVLSMGKAFLFNRYSSLSGMAYEMAVVHGRAEVDGPNVMCW